MGLLYSCMVMKGSRERKRRRREGCPDKDNSISLVVSADWLNKNDNKQRLTNKENCI